jgi:Photoprotection regulator fluorescence recovery protein
MSSQGLKDGYVEMRDLHWSPAEKATARKAFEGALARELQTVLDEVKNRVSKIEQTSELWELERFLGERRKEIDVIYDYKYSHLPLVLGALMRRGQLREDDLHGLGEDKLARIRGAAAL